jgi:hypothetical protein
MAVSVICDTCGKRLNVKEESIGKKVRCPACKNPFTASPSGAIRVKKVIKEKEAKVSISWGFISMIAGAVAAVVFVILIIVGPVRAKHQWDPMAEKADSDIRDVLERGFGRVYVIQMLWDMFVMGLPEKIHFKGTTPEGEFTGTYNTKTLEVDADVEVGGATVPGLDYAHRHGDRKIHINGWNKDGELKVWVEGRLWEPPAPKTKPTRPVRTFRPPTAPATKPAQ